MSELPLFSAVGETTQGATMCDEYDLVQQYWDRRPCNLRHSPKPIGSRAYFEEVSKRRYFVEPHIRAFAAFPDWKGKKVLEVGCGIGTDGANFARAGADYTGVELSPASLSLARQHFHAFGLQGNFTQANAETMCAYFDPRSFDLIYSFGVIHHTPQPDAVLREARRLIRDDGQLRIMVYARDSWKAAMIEAGLDQPEAQPGCPIAYTYSRDEAGDLVRSSGFEPISITQDHIFPYVVEKYLQYEYELQPWFAAMPPEMLATLKRRFGWHLLVVARPA